jgi:hypothetical protein
MTIFEKILHKEKNDLTQPNIPNRKELLEELRNNNCRELVNIDINLHILSQDKVLFPDRIEQVKQTITMLKGKMKDLIIGVEYIDKELQQYAKDNKGGKKV